MNAFAHGFSQHPPKKSWFVGLPTGPALETALLVTTSPGIHISPERRDGLRLMLHRSTGPHLATKIVPTEFGFSLWLGSFALQKWTLAFKSLKSQGFVRMSCCIELKTWRVLKSGGIPKSPLVSILSHGHP